MFSKLIVNVKTSGSLTIVGLSAFLLIAISNLYASSNSNRSRNLHFQPPPGVEHFTFGFSGVLADSMWIRVLQDFDFCEEKDAAQKCKSEGWVYHILDSISHVDPHFRVPLFTGGLMLTVIINDTDGASKIFDRAVELFPNDWPILYEAGYQALFREKNREKAGLLLERAGHSGAPKWVFALAAKMYTQAGEQEYAERLYQNLKDSGASEEILNPIKDRLLGKGPHSPVTGD